MGIPATTAKSILRPRNQIIRPLAERGSKSFVSKLEQVELERNAVLYEVGKPIKWVYFPENCVITFLGDTGEGREIEVWSVGAEGFAGVPGIIDGFFPYRGVVSISGKANVVDADGFRSFMEQGRELNTAVCRYCQRLILDVAQIGLCNSAHEVEQRFCRWLLMMQRRTGLRTLAFTQEFIARVLGTRRASISVAAASLQSAGLIRYTSGSITILSRRQLLAVACACVRRIDRTSAKQKQLTIGKS